MSLQEIEASVAGLTSEEFGKFSNWFDDYAAKQAEAEADAWDAQIEADVKAGRLDKWLKEVDEDIAAGRYTEI